MKAWKYGIIYSDKNDSRLWVPKKNKKLGWTINMAKPTAKVIVFLVVVSILLVFILATFS